MSNERTHWKCPQCGRSTGTITHGCTWSGCHAIRFCCPACVFEHMKQHQQELQAERAAHALLTRTHEALERQYEGVVDAHEETKATLEDYKKAWNQGAEILEEADPDICQDSIYSVLDILDMMGAAQHKIMALEAHLRSLAEAAEAYRADQSGADPRCGNVQPISVEEGVALNVACDKAWEVLKDD